MKACLNVKANSFLKCNSLPTRFRVETAGRVRGREGKAGNNTSQTQFLYQGLALGQQVGSREREKLVFILESFQFGVSVHKIRKGLACVKIRIIMPKIVNKQCFVFLQVVIFIFTRGLTDIISLNIIKFQSAEYSPLLKMINSGAR